LGSSFALLFVLCAACQGVIHSEDKGYFAMLVAVAGRRPERAGTEGVVGGIEAITQAAAGLGARSVRSSGWTFIQNAEPGR